MPFLALLGLFYAVFFSVPVFMFNPRFWRAAPDETGVLHGYQLDEVSVRAQLIVLLGICLLGAFYLLSRRYLWPKVPHLRLPRNYPAGRLRLLLWMLLAGHLAYQSWPLLRSVASIGQFLLPAGTLALGMLVVLWRHGQLAGLEKLALALVIFPFIVIKGVGSGLLTELILLLGFVTIILYYLRIRLFWLPAVLALLGALLLYPSTTRYRMVAWSNDGVSLSYLDKIRLAAGLGIDNWSRAFPVPGGTRTSAITRRIARIVVMSYVVELTPHAVPYLKGVSYMPLLTSFIPRLLWPGKPEERFGQAFGHRYRILRPNDDITSVNVPWVLEMFANFGVVGVAIGMSLAGIVLALLSAVFNNRAMSPLEFVTGAAILFPLAYQASNLSVMTGVLVPLAICLWFYFRFGLTVGVSPPARN